MLNNERELLFLVHCTQELFHSEIQYLQTAHLLYLRGRSFKSHLFYRVLVITSNILLLSFRRVSRESYLRLHPNLLMRVSYCRVRIIGSHRLDAPNAVGGIVCPCVSDAERRDSG